MPIVAVEIVAPEEAPVMTRAMLDACSAAVRSGRCELATEATSEPRLASVTVRWSDTSERSARIDVTGVAPDTAAVRLRVLAFKDTDAVVERWRSVGLTIATLVGDALANAPPGATHSEEDSSGHADTAAGTPPGNPGEPGESPAGAHATVGVPVEVPKESATATHVDRAERPTSPRREAAEPPASTPPLPNKLWATVAGQTGPGLEEGGFRFGVSGDVAFRPVKFPVFARVAFGYSSRGTDSRGLSVQWATGVAGAGFVIGTEAFRAEPRIGLGIENVHASATDAATGKSESGNALDPSLQLGLDGVFQLGHFGFVGSLEGTQKHAATQIIVKGHDFGTSAATTWAIGVGVRYYAE
jgi:hypothetical protein